MAETCETVKVKSDNPEHEAGFIEINAHDFVEGVHELFEEVVEDLNQLKLGLEKGAEAVVAAVTGKGGKKAAQTAETGAAAAPAAEEPPAGAAGDPGAGWGSGPAGEAQG
jgi:hypothetical protein